MSYPIEFEYDAEVNHGPYADHGLCVPIKVTIECSLDGDDNAQVDSIKLNHALTGACIKDVELEPSSMMRIIELADEQAAKHERAIYADAVESARMRVESQREDGST